MTSPQPNLASVARLSKVSISTASRALQNHPDISLATQERVKKTAEALGYRGNCAARTLLTGKSNLVAFLHSGQDLYWHELSQTVCGTFAERGCFPVFCPTADNPAWERYFIESLLEHRASGALWMPCLATDVKAMVECIASARMPVVVLDRYASDCAVTFVHTDDAAGAAMAMRHVLEQGHRRIGLVLAPLISQPIQWRKEGYLAALDEAGIPSAQVVVQQTTAFTYEASLQCSLEMLSLKERPTAVLASTDEQAWAALDAARELQISVPKDLRIIGYGDYLSRRHTQCALSTVSQNREKVAATAVDCLIQAMRKGYEPTHKRVVLPVELKIKDT